MENLNQVKQISKFAENLQRASSIIKTLTLEHERGLEALRELETAMESGARLLSFDSSTPTQDELKNAIDHLGTILPKMVSFIEINAREAELFTELSSIMNRSIQTPQPNNQELIRGYA